MAVNELIDYMVLKRKEMLESMAGKRYPRNYQIASDISDCDRQVVYGVLNWQERKLFNEYVQAMLQRGNTEEVNVMKDLLDMGLKVIETQTPFEIKNRAGAVICRGKIDGKILYEGKKYPFELKTMNINSFNGIRSLDDFQKKPHLRKYLRQVQLYLFGHEHEEGLFILTDLQGHYKLIPVYLDYGECELLLQRIEKNAEHIAAKTLPEKMNYNPAVCEKCPFAQICLPDTKTEGAQLIEDAELEDQLQRRAELAPLVSEYGDIDDEVKERFRTATDVFVGTSWRIFTIKRPGKRLDLKAIPEDIKKQYEVPTETVIVKILDLNEGKQPVEKKPAEKKAAKK
jgi:CRISPR/Cas system-associated exonuclease Cas4 (RecB family)